jgi:hypothetical protein
LTIFPAVGKTYRASENAFILASHYMRFELAKLHLQIAQDMGISFEGKEGDLQLKSIGTMVNSITARGKIGNKNSAPGWVNALMWSPKMFKGALDVSTAHMFNKDMKGTYGRSAAVKNLLKVIGGVALIKVIAGLIDPDSVEWDPRSADAAYIRVGDTRFAMPGSDLLALMVLGTRVGLGLTEKLTGIKSMKSSTSDSTYFLTEKGFREYGIASVILDFFFNKSSPAFGVLLNHLKGEDRQGNAPTVLGDIRDLFAPMPASTAKELLSNPKAANTFGAMILDHFGSSTNTYPDSPRYVFKQAQDTISQAMYQKPFEDLTPSQQSSVSKQPDILSAQKTYDSRPKKDEPFEIKQTLDEFETAKRILAAFPPDIQRKITDKGIDSIGIKSTITVNGNKFYLNDKRFKAYEDLVVKNLISMRGNIAGQSNEKDMRVIIDKQKDLARETLLQQINSGRL